MLEDFMESTIRKSAVACTTREWKMSARGFRWVGWFAGLMMVSFPAVGVAQSSCPGIHVEVLNIRNSIGTVACALFESPVGFPNEYMHHATHLAAIKVRDTRARCHFVDIAPGTYALAVVHDENMNGKLDTNWLGIPIEGYGFSNDARALLGPPSFAAASFQYDGENLELTISLRY
jgi:uncharacterized protein (DUF2141 family)